METAKGDQTDKNKQSNYYVEKILNLYCNII